MSPCDAALWRTNRRIPRTGRAKHFCVTSRLSFGSLRERNQSCKANSTCQVVESSRALLDRTWFRLDFFASSSYRQSSRLCTLVLFLEAVGERVVLIDGRNYVAG